MALEAERYVILTHQQAVHQVRERVRQFVVLKWRGLTAWRDADIDAFAQAVVPAVESGQRTIAQLTDAYLTAMARMAGDAPLPSAMPLSDFALRGVDPYQVYLRPGTTVWTALSEGKPLTEAVAMGLQRAHSLAMTDLQMAQQEAAQRKMQGMRIVGYRRVLTGAENCALCMIASTQRYHKEQLNPIHPGCDCGVVPIYGDRDPGQLINEDRYQSITSALDQQGVSDTHTGTGDNRIKDGNFRDLTLITVRTHGEYGPTLSWREQAFTGPADI